MKNLWLRFIIQHKNNETVEKELFKLEISIYFNKDLSKLQVFLFHFTKYLQQKIPPFYPKYSVSFETFIWSMFLLSRSKKKKEKNLIPCFKSHFITANSYIFFFLQVLINSFPHALSNKQEARGSVAWSRKWH